MPIIRNQLLPVIERYTPTMLPVVLAASAEDIAQLSRIAGPLPDSYLEFLEWMGAWCPFLYGAQLASSPAALLEAYQDPELPVPDGFILIGVDTSGSALSAFIRRDDGVVVRLSDFYDGTTDQTQLVENGSFASFLVRTYVQKTLVPSHPFHFACAFEGDDERCAELWRRVDEACGNFEIPFSIAHPDFRLYGGHDFVLGVHQRPGSSAVYLSFGAVDRARYEVWYDLVFARWHLLRMPVL